MLLVGYFEGIDSQRGIAWRCADSLSLRRFLFLETRDEAPDHSSLTNTRNRLPVELFEQVFAFVLNLARVQKLLQEGPLTVGVDSTTLEANAAMKAIVRKESGEGWQAYLKRLMQEQGLIDKDDTPTDEDLRKFDKDRAKQGKKKVSNDEWESPIDPDARIIKLKDGRTHLGYKAEHVVDLDSDLILAATVLHGTDGDAESLLPSLAQAQENLVAAGSAATIKEVAADKGYHANQTLVDCTEAQVRTYIPERDIGERTWVNKTLEEEQAFRNNRRRVQGDKGRRLQRLRSELVERSFAHICETGGARRTWLRGLDKINKRYVIQAAAKNLGTVMRRLFGLGTPRFLQGMDVEALLAELRALWGAWASRGTLLKLTACLGRQLIAKTRGSPMACSPPPNFAAT
jgi:IS5 family transposase